MGAAAPPLAAAPHPVTAAPAAKAPAPGSVHPLPPADPRLLDRAGARLCLRLSVLPLRDVGGAVLLASAAPLSPTARRRLVQRLGPVVTCTAPRREIQDEILRLRRGDLVREAERGLPAAHSCRDLAGPGRGQLMSGGLLALTGLSLGSPSQVFTLVFILAACVLALNTFLKVAAALRAWRRPQPVPEAVVVPLTTAVAPARRPVLAETEASAGSGNAGADVAQARLPMVSVLVPLLREERITERLMQRLGRLDYPSDRLEICLIVEERDRPTRAGLSCASLPDHVRVIVVPHGPLRTKPRALNFALPFCRGSIIGIYDAEDAPEPDQIRKVVQHLFQAGSRVACVQCVLDYYNTDTNWLSRCFTIEYATWFRVVLPGFEGLGLPIPLGGTSLFIRRAVLEELGGWDAHNVTEDADLGIRLARFGYRTELAASVTREEATCRIMPWVRQRSRWLKGYAMTYMVHMHRPGALLRDLGLRRFLALQVLFLGTLIGFALAPVLLSFWLLSFGLLHPAALHLSPEAVRAFQVGFLLAEIAAMAVALLAVARRGTPPLMPWILSMHLYFPLASLAMTKAAGELLFLPFYWDKTPHGVDPAAREAGGAGRPPA
nr:glycosyltransferase family 2 protein [Brevirhabdus pacifica]